MAPLNELHLQARRARLRARLLRAEVHRLAETNAAVTRDSTERLRTCDETVIGSRLRREGLPTWPAWSAPGPELRSTLVPLE